MAAITCMHLALLCCWIWWNIFIYEFINRKVLHIPFQWFICTHGTICRCVAHHISLTRSTTSRQGRFSGFETFEPLFSPQFGLLATLPHNMQLLGLQAGVLGIPYPLPITPEAQPIETAIFVAFDAIKFLLSEKEMLAYSSSSSGDIFWFWIFWCRNWVERTRWQKLWLTYDWWIK